MIEKNYGNDESSKGKTEQFTSPQSGAFISNEGPGIICQVTWMVKLWKWGRKILVYLIIGNQGGLKELSALDFTILRIFYVLKYCLLWFKKHEICHFNHFKCMP